MLSGEQAILATRKLKEDERRLFTPTDLRRLDGDEGCVCCSIEYPNGWYFDKARGADALFRDWVVLLIKPDYLWMEGTRFCPRNAAAGAGREIARGSVGFLKLFTTSVVGAYGRRYVRLRAHLNCCPTDDQAEVLVPDRIPLADVLGVVVSSESQAKNEVARIRIAQAPRPPFPILISPTLFDKQALSAAIRSNTRPSETRWKG
jgi:hypothetical protein